MFRRLPHSLPKNPDIEVDLEKLGYMITADDQVRMIRDPKQKFQFKINRNDRINEIHKAAMNTCINNLVIERFHSLNFRTIPLPLGTSVEQNHVPVLVSKDLGLKQRVLVIFGQRHADLGIFSYRTIGEEGIRVGSAEELVRAYLMISTADTADDDRGVIIANPGQLIWHRASSRAISYSTYHGLPGETAVHEPFRIDPIKNRIPGNTDYAEHVQCIFENVMTWLTHSDVKFDIIGLEYTGDAVVHYLANHWDTWQGRINGICLGNPQLKVKELMSNGTESTDFTKFFAKRARAYFVSAEPLETPLAGRDEIGCNCYASGERMYEEAILVRSWRSMLDWFGMIRVVESYEEPVFTVVTDEGTDGDLAESQGGRNQSPTGAEN